MVFTCRRPFFGKDSEYNTSTLTSLRVAAKEWSLGVIFQVERTPRQRYGLTTLGSRVTIGCFLHSFMHCRRSIDGEAFYIETRAD